MPDAPRSSILNPRSIILWSGAQMLAVLLAAPEFPLWAHHPYPRSSLALQELMAVQLILASLLCPVLSGTWWTLVANVLISWAFIELAGLLASQPQTIVLQSWTFVSLWQFGLCGLARQLEQQRQIWLVCGAILWTGGGVILMYLRAERIASLGLGAADWTAVGPLAGGSHMLDKPAWLQSSLPLACWLIWRVIQYLKTAQIRPSTSLH